MFIEQLVSLQVFSLLEAAARITDLSVVVVLHALLPGSFYSFFQTLF